MHIIAFACLAAILDLTILTAQKRPHTNDRTSYSDLLTLKPPYFNFLKYFSSSFSYETTLDLSFRWRPFWIWPVWPVWQPKGDLKSMKGRDNQILWHRKPHKCINLYHYSPFSFRNYTWPVFNTQMAAILDLTSMTSMTAPRRPQIDERTS